jgi:hypothetical protein
MFSQIALDRGITLGAGKAVPYDKARDYIYAHLHLNHLPDCSTPRIATELHTKHLH